MRSAGPRLCTPEICRGSSSGILFSTRPVDVAISNAPRGYSVAQQWAISDKRKHSLGTTPIVACGLYDCPVARPLAAFRLGHLRETRFPPPKSPSAEVARDCFPEPANASGITARLAANRLAL